MTPIDTAELERLAAEITPGEWRHFMGDICADLQGDDTVICGMNKSCGARSSDYYSYKATNPTAQANARAIALLPALLREVLARRKAEAGMRALLRAGCDLLAIESEALRNSIRIVGNPDRMSDAPEDAHAVEAIREMEDWIASVKATLRALPESPTDD